MDFLLDIFAGHELTALFVNICDFVFLKAALLTGGKNTCRHVLAYTHMITYQGFLISRIKEIRLTCINSILLPTDVQISQCLSILSKSHLIILLL